MYVYQAVCMRQLSNAKTLKSVRGEFFMLPDSIQMPTVTSQIYIYNNLFSYVNQTRQIHEFRMSLPSFKNLRIVYIKSFLQQFA